jgi:hypothetical protein
VIYLAKKKLIPFYDTIIIAEIKGKKYPVKIKGLKTLKDVEYFNKTQMTEYYSTNLFKVSRRTIGRRLLDLEEIENAGQDT